MQAIDWQRVVEEHGPAVWRTAYRLLGNDTDAADCFQETFVSALEVSRRQRVRNFSALLARLVTARAVDRLRQRFRHQQYRSDAADLVLVASERPWPAHQAQEREFAGQLRKALAFLSPHEAQVFCLRHLSDMSYRQIGKSLGIKTSTVGVLLHRARTKLRRLLEAPVGKERTRARPEE